MLHPTFISAFIGDRKGAGGGAGGGGRIPAIHVGINISNSGGCSPLSPLCQLGYLCTPRCALVGPFGLPVLRILSPSGPFFRINIRELTGDWQLSPSFVNNTNAFLSKMTAVLNVQRFYERLDKIHGHFAKHR